jgi:hypothetical protein
MEPKVRVCPDCEAENDVGLNRRDFLRTVSVTAADSPEVCTAYGRTLVSLSQCTSSSK